MADPEVKARLDEYNTWFPKPVPRYPTCFCERCQRCLGYKETYLKHRMLHGPTYEVEAK
jgi:hypothetical protein